MSGTSWAPRRPGSSSAVRTVGIAGGGQLARMMLPAAAELGLAVVVLDPDPACSAAELAQEVVVGAFDSPAALRELAGRCDVLTFEIERVDAATLQVLEGEGYVVRPPAATLAVVQDKLTQKRFLEAQGIPTSRFAPFEPGAALGLPLPCVWKVRRGGYDGRGVAMLRTAHDVAHVPQLPALVEALVAIDYELATLVARGADGELVHYPVVEIVMDDDAHVMDRVIAPCAAPAAVVARCRALAAQLAAALDYVGVLALEFFVDRDGEIYVNELSPRPHNSGHYTIEACASSQFEQHLRAVAGLPLGSTELRSAAVTFNVLGAPGAVGRPRYIGFDACAEDDAVFVHCYDKVEVRPGRKMAHVTVLAATRAEAIERAARVRSAVRVEGPDD